MYLCISESRPGGLVMVGTKAPEKRHCGCLLGGVAASWVERGRAPTEHTQTKKEIFIQATEEQHTQELCLLVSLLPCSSHGVGPARWPHLERGMGMRVGSRPCPGETLNKGRWEGKKQQTSTGDLDLQDPIPGPPPPCASPRPDFPQELGGHSSWLIQPNMLLPSRMASGAFIHI